MAVELRMPKLGLTMEEGTITAWLRDDGDVVEAGSVVLVIETDKTETEVESPHHGRLHRIGQVGETYPCGTVIGWLLEEGEDLPSVARPAVAQPGGEQPVAAAATPSVTAADTDPVALGGRDRLFASPNARRLAAETGVDLQRLRGTGPGGRIVSEDVEEALARGAATGPGPAQVEPAATSPGVLATFAARSLADLLGVDIGAITPARRGDVVDREDVAAYVRRLLADAASPPVSAPLEQTPTAIVPLAGVRGTIAKRMHASLREMAQLTLTMDADLDAVVAHRSACSARGSEPPGYTDYVVAATARALRAHPIVNSQVVADGIALLPDVHVGIAVATDRGLLVPVVRHADRLGLAALSAETRRLVAAARDGTIRRQDLEGGTFAVSALGMFGVDAFTPIVNPPNVAILGVGRLRDDVAWDDDGSLRRARRLTLSLTWDHRVLDGAPAAEFCRTVVELLADPGALEGQSPASAT